jgi:hypothetical protein
MDIIEQRERFLDYAEERGAHVAGASSVQGEAPKYLLAEDHAGMFHAEGALPDEKIRQFWLVKFPRGSRTDERNQQVLRNEANYLEVARKFGIRTGEPMVYEDDVLSEWAVICEKLKNLMPPKETRIWLADLGERVKRLPEMMQNCCVDDAIIQRLTGWIDEVAAGLVETRPKTLK